MLLLTGDFSFLVFLVMVFELDFHVFIELHTDLILTVFNHSGVALSPRSSVSVKCSWFNLFVFLSQLFGVCVCTCNRAAYQQDNQ